MSISFYDETGIERLRKARKEKMQEIIPGPWLGSQEALYDEKLLERNDITHIVTVMPTFINKLGIRTTQLSSEVHQYYDSKLSRLIIPADDISTQNMLQYFPRSTEFILHALCDGGCVLVHCLAGASRSPTVVAAFLMKVYRLTPSQAVAKIRESRPLVRPIVSFFDQLQVYEACDYGPFNQPVYLHWQLRARCETEIDIPKNIALLPR
jgi:protein-tyrosine phosphatase